MSWLRWAVDVLDVMREARERKGAFCVCRHRRDLHDTSPESVDEPCFVCPCKEFRTDDRKATR